MLKERIESDLKTSMKNADSFRVGILRLLKSAIQNEVINQKVKTGSDEATDELVISVLKREAKKHKESIAIYSESGRLDLSEPEERELKVIQEYLPEELSREAIEVVVRDVIASGASEFSSVMKEAMARFGGAADGKIVSEVVKSLLG